ncbi:uncharacterized protein RSE6_02433 [Rhynchosporium secalis]|uniref:DUF7726 domain-containing protein n=1 Tax=Rhynchosporium secalis TaxID=38038 RepID=A0A1E1M089_RHYSE|nr:uncharacterized protein RSE6_02433 [Rhynchosporium secalis]
MKVGEFQRAISASSSTYSGFLGAVFTEKKRVEGTSSTEGTKAGEGSKAVEKTDTDFGDIVLFGEAENEVEVYDSCDGDEIRRKIRQYLSKTGMSQAAFAREIGKSFHPEKKIRKKGPTVGDTSSAFYGSYLVFEKMRIKNKKPKTQRRLGIEIDWDGLNSFSYKKPVMRVTKLQDRETHIVPVGESRSIYQEEFCKPQMGF